MVATFATRRPNLAYFTVEDNRRTNAHPACGRFDILKFDAAEHEQKSPKRYAIWVKGVGRGDASLRRQKYRTRYKIGIRVEFLVLAFAVYEFHKPPESKMDL